MQGFTYHQSDSCIVGPTTFRANFSGKGEPRTETNTEETKKTQKEKEEQKWPHRRGKWTSR